MMNSNFESIEIQLKYFENGVAISKTIGSNSLTFKLNKSLNYHVI